MIAAAAAALSIRIYIYMYNYVYIYIYENLTRSSYKNFLGASQKNFHTSTSAEHFNRISTRSSDKDLYEIMQGHLEDFTGTSSRASHKDLHETWTKIFMPEPLREAHKIIIKGPAAAGAGLTRS